MQHEFAIRDGDETVVERVGPESRAARFPNAHVEMHDGFEIAGCAGLARKHPASRLPGELSPLCVPALQEGGEASSDQQLQRLAVLDVLNTDGHGDHVDLRSGEGNHICEADVRIKPEAEGLAGYHVGRSRLGARVPACRHPHGGSMRRRR